jgi:hypothetical protein
MNDLGQLFDAFYSRFILRDFLGKITPGTIFLSALALWFKSPTDLFQFSYYKDIPLMFWILFLAIAWLVGFTMQSFGELKFPKIGPLIEYYPHPQFFSDSKWMEFYVSYTDLIRTGEYPEDARGIERMVCIKEACGNGYVAILWSIGTLALKVGYSYNSIAYHELIAPASGILFLLLIMILLRCMHYKHVWRLYNYMLTFLEKHSKEASMRGWPRGKTGDPRWVWFLICVVVGIFLMFVTGWFFGQILIKDPPVVS